MTVIQLKYFLALAETLNFSQVAEQFYVAQTAISYSIKALENELGAKLFERTTKKVELTPAGHIFYTRVKSAVQIIDLAQNNIKQDPDKVHLTVGCSRLCSGPTFYRAAESFQKENRHVKLLLCADEPEISLMDRLADGQIDLAIYMKAPYSPIPTNSVTRSFRAPLPRKVILSRSNPLCSLTDGIPNARLVDETMISYGNLESTRRYLPSTLDFSLEEQSIRRATVASDFHSMLDMVGANLGVACLPLVDDLHTESVCSRTCLEKIPQYPSIGATYIGTNAQPVVRAFIDTLFDALKERFPDGFPDKSDS